MANQRQPSRRGRTQPTVADIRALLDSAIKAGLIKGDATIQEVVNFAQQAGRGPAPFDYIIAWSSYFFVCKEF